jgi:hypothetical protein
MRKQVRLNKKDYVKVFNKIIDINSNYVCFEAETLYHGQKCKGEVGLNRESKSTGFVIWDLLPDGLFVHREYVKSYQLSTNPIN